MINNEFKKNKIDISIVIPCYNEEQSQLHEQIKRISGVLEKTRYSYEIILINDGSEDNTLNIIKNICQNNKKYKLYSNDKNIGRGGAVSKGFRKSKGDIVGFIDIDLSTDPLYILSLVNKLENGYDVAVAHRTYKLKFKLFVLNRWIISEAYKFLLKLFLGKDFGDTETGCKFFRREKIIPLLDKIKNQEWFWDTEIMVRANLQGLRIVEIPTVFIRKNAYTRVKIIRDSWLHLINLIKLSIEIKTKKQ